MYVNYLIPLSLNKKYHSEKAMKKAIDQAITRFNNKDYGQVLGSQKEHNRECMEAHTGKIYGSYDSPEGELLIMIDFDRQRPHAEQSGYEARILFPLEEEVFLLDGSGNVLTSVIDEELQF